MNRKLASSLSRVWQFIEDKNRSFGIVSAFRNDHIKMDNKSPTEDEVKSNKKQNIIASKKKHKELKEKIRDMGLGYVELAGGTQETNQQGQAINVLEDSLFIPNISKDDLLNLGREYNQDSVIYKNGGQFAMLITKGPNFGKSDMDFGSSQQSKNITFDPELIKSVGSFSALKKGPDSGEKFLFQPPADPLEELVKQVKDKKDEDKSASENTVFKMSKSDWETIGKTAGWLSDTFAGVSEKWESIMQKVKSILGMPIDTYAEENRILREDTANKRKELKYLLDKKSNYEKILNKLEGLINSGQFKSDPKRQEMMENAALAVSAELEKIEILKSTIEANMLSLSANKSMSAMQ